MSIPLTPLRSTKAGMIERRREGYAPFACVRGREQAKPKERTQERGMHGEVWGQPTTGKHPPSPLTFHEGWIIRHSREGGNPEGRCGSWQSFPIMAIMVQTPFATCVIFVYH